MREKRRLRKGALSFALAVIMIIGTLTGIVPGTSIKVKAETATGVWSSGINYSYDTATGVLTLTGNGSTTVGSSTVVLNDTSYPATINEPFSNISRIVISEGITSIDDMAFADWGNNVYTFRNNLTIEIPSTVTSIGDWAFSSITNGSVSVIMNASPNNITTFYTNAFCGSKNGEFITPYASEWKESGKCSYDSTNNTITFNSTYKGTFTLSGVTYTVRFKDYDGTVLKTQENVEYNTSATAPDDPTREGYTFTGWDKTFTNITANTEVTAQYAINKYTVTFKDYDGSVLKTQENVEYNTSATAPDDPTREGYTFTGWDKTFTNITANTEVTAQYAINKYTVTFKDYNGTVLKTQENVEYKKSAIAPAEPTRDGYTFTGWDKAFTEITADTTITATYSINSYTVTWTNYDDTVLKTDTVDYGETPAYTGATPTKPADAQYTYTFVGWTPEINTVTGDVTYKATYTNAKNKYTVRWLNYDNTVLQEGTVDYGETPEYTGDTPTKPADEKYTYTFLNWTPVVIPVVDNVVYIATYTNTVNKYTIKFVDEDGTEISSAEYDYGTSANDIVKPDDPTKDATAEYTYKFAGWDSEVTDVTGNKTYKATYTQTEIKKDDGEKAVSTEVKKDEKSPEVKAANLTNEFAESTLSNEEKADIEDAINNGEDVKVDVYLEIEDISDTISASDKEKIKASVTNADNIEYFDISLFKEISISGRSQGAASIHDLTTPLKLTIGVPKSFPAVADGYKRTYVVLRLHDGSVTVLPTTLNADGTLSFETDKFSTYALAYTDTKKEEVTTETPTTKVDTPTTEAPKADTPKAPTTGDKINLGVIVMLMIDSAMAGLYLTLRRRLMK